MLLNRISTEKHDAEAKIPARLIVTGNCAIYLANITGTGKARQDGISVVTI